MCYIYAVAREKRNKRTIEAMLPYHIISATQSSLQGTEYLDGYLVLAQA
jgi:hypothetical protein